LFVIQKDMKDIFRKLLRQGDHFKKSLERAHNKFYQKIFKERKFLYDGMEKIGVSGEDADYYEEMYNCKNNVGR
jgi:hypothetical protein